MKAKLGGPDSRRDSAKRKAPPTPPNMRTQSLKGKKWSVRRILGFAAQNKQKGTGTFISVAMLSE